MTEKTIDFFNYIQKELGVRNAIDNTNHLLAFCALVLSDDKLLSMYRDISKQWETESNSPYMFQRIQKQKAILDAELAKRGILEDV